MSDLNNKISIIVPMYNVEQYADECIASIIAQTYTNLEIILVDDGSRDATSDICDKWRQKDKRIRVIHKENGGLSDARNSGMAIMSGELVGFVDGDDWIHPRMYELLCRAMIQNDCDCVCGGMQAFISSEKLKPETEDEETFSYDKEEFIQKVISGEDKFTYGVPFKLYRRSLINGLLFEKGIYYEDVNFFTEACLKSKNIIFVDIPLYFYRYRDTSITGGELTEKHVRDYVHVWDKERIILKTHMVSFPIDEYCWLELYRMKQHIYKRGKDKKQLQIINRGIDDGQFRPWCWGVKRIMQYYLSRYAMWALAALQKVL